MSQVTIVGAGVMGLCVATELINHGVTPHVVDKQAEPGPKSCAWWAGGMLAPYCEVESAEPDVLELGRQSANWWRSHTNKVTMKGTLVVAPNRDKGELRQFARRTHGYQEVNQTEIGELEPDLNGKFAQGLYFADEAHLAPREALKTLRDNLIEKGATFSQNTVEPSILAQSQLTIDCRGIGAKQDINELRGVKGEMLILHCPDVQLNRPVRLLHPRMPLYIVPRGEGVFMLGATMIESSAKQHVTVRSIMEMLNAAYTLNSAFAEAEILEIGVDSRPAYDNNLPKIEQHGQLITANGLYRHGFLLAPAMAQQVRQLVLQGETHI